VTQLKLGFIGGGINSAVGSAHFVACNMDNKFKVEAGCFSRHEEINIKTAEQWGVVSDRVYSTWQQMLISEVGKLDAIVVLTPTPDHREPVLTALKSGFSVICEKALASSSKEAREMLNVVEAERGYLSVTYNYTGYPMVRELREMIRRGKLGKIEQVHIEMPQAGFARLNRDGGPMTPQDWRLKDNEVSTISLDLGVHVFHMVGFLINEKPYEIVATQKSFGRFKQVIDNTLAIVNYTSDIECSIWFSKSAVGHNNGLRVRIYGVEGSAEWYQMDPEILIFNDSFGRQIRIDRANSDTLIAHESRYNRFKSGHPAGFLEAFANLYTDIAEDLARIKKSTAANNEFTFTPRHALDGLLVLEAIEVSARERRWVDIEVDG